MTTKQILLVIIFMGFQSNLLTQVAQTAGKQRDINAQHKQSGDTLLHFAVKKGGINDVKKFLKFKADPNIENNSGHSPLHLAIINHAKLTSDSIIDALLEANSSSNNLIKAINIIVEKFGDNTKLKILLCRIIKKLYELDPNSFKIKFYDENTMLNLICSTQELFIGHNFEPIETIGLLIEVIESAKKAWASSDDFSHFINAQNSAGNTALHSSLKNRNFKFARILIDNNADISIENNKKETSLHLICLTEEKEQKPKKLHDPEDPKGFVFIETGTLLEKIIDTAQQYIFLRFINAQDNRGNTALHNAALMSNYTSADILMKKGADPNIQNTQGETPLHIACIRLDHNFIKKFLAKNANVNLASTLGKTPLHIAVANNDAYTISLLLAKDANIDARDKNGNIAADYAKSINIKRLLLQKKLTNIF